nr:MAG TPA: hypothetical protein [Caudoviricetes sp.]
MGKYTLITVYISLKVHAKTKVVICNNSLSKLIINL